MAVGNEQVFCSSAKTSCASYGLKGAQRVQGRLRRPKFSSSELHVISLMQAMQVPIMEESDKRTGKPASFFGNGEIAQKRISYDRGCRLREAPGSASRLVRFSSRKRCGRGRAASPLGCSVQAAWWSSPAPEHRSHRRFRYVTSCRPGVSSDGSISSHLLAQSILKLFAGKFCGLSGILAGWSSRTSAKDHFQ